MIRQDNVQVRMEIDGKQAINELGKQELAAYEYRQEIKQIKEEQSLLEKESRSIDKIRERYEKLGARMKELEDAGKSNTQTYKKTLEQFGKVSAQLQSAEKATKELANSQAKYNTASGKLDDTKNKINALRESLGVSGMTMRQLRKYQSELNREMDAGVTKGTVKYEELKKKIQQVNGAINKQRADVNGLDSAWAKVRGELTKFGVLALGYLGAQELLGRVQNLIRGSADLSDAISNVQKTTGLANAEVKDLSKTFASWNTRTARADLLAMAEIAGRLGLQGKSDIEGFVQAADQINIALGDSLGEVETVMRDLGKLTATFKVQEQYGIEESLLKVGSAINELGMSSTANEGYIVEFTKRMSGIAPLAKISIENVMGLAATLDSLGQTSEVSTTALSKLFIDMAKNAKQYARFAKMEMNDFVKLMNEDANEAFLRMLEGVKENSNGITELAGTLGDLGQDGGRVVGVLGTLANNTRILREQQLISNTAFEKGTSVTEEFAIKNENLAASLAKVQRWINHQFINSAFLGFMETTIGKLADWVVGIDKATRAFQNQEKYVDSLESGLPKLTSRFEELNSKSNKSTSEQTALKGIIEDIAKLVPTAITEFDNYGNAISISTEKVNAFTKAQIEAKRILNAEAIKEQQKELEKLQMDIQRVSWSLEKMDEDGDLFKNLTSTSGLAQKQVKLTSEEISKLQKRMRDLSDQKLGRMQILEDLKGIDEAVKAGREAFAASFSRVKPDENNEDKETPVDEDAIKKAQKDYEDLIQEFKKYQEGLRNLDEEHRLSLLDRDSQEIAKVEKKYEQLLKSAQEYRDKKLLTESQYQEQENHLLEMQTEEVDLLIKTRSEKIKEERAKLQADIDLKLMTSQESELAKVALQYDKLIEQAREYGLQTAELEAAKQVAIDQVSINALEKEKEALTKKYDQIIQMARSNGMPIFELEKAKNEALLNLNKGFNASILDQDADRLDRSFQKEVEIANAKMELYRQVSFAIGGAIDMIGNRSGELTGFQKVLTLAQIAIDSASALGKVVPLALDASKGTGPAAPFVFAGYLASMIGTVFGAIGKARSALSDANVPTWTDSSGESAAPTRGRVNAPKGKSYFFGGATGDGMGFGDQFGEYAGYVHKHEYVIPETVRNEPIVQMQIEPILESLRMKKMGRSFYFGGETSSKTSAGSSSAMPSNARMESLMESLIQKVDNWPKTVRGKWVYSDLEDIQEEVEDLRKRYKA